MGASELKKRIQSALILISLVGLVLLLGGFVSWIFLGLLGSLLIDEYLTNFIRITRSDPHYKLSQTFYVGCFLTTFFFSDILSYYLLIAALALNFLYALFLFLPEQKIFDFPLSLNKRPLSVSLLFFFPIGLMATLTFQSSWRQLFLVLLILNFSVDIGAWVVGRSLGKHKLWPEISPKKTWEGLIGGIILGVFSGCLSWKYLMGNLNTKVFLGFLVLAAFAQLGDLIQSKIKRQFHLKDSSSLIPGHGGVYDRVDSLLFVAPFYFLCVNSIF